MPVTRREAVLAALSAPALSAAAGVPQVPFGKHMVSRLMVGGNPVSGNSHLSGAMSREMLDYFTAANVKKLLADCERAGINVWQSRGDRHIIRVLREYRQEGGRIQWIAQTASEFADIPRNIRDIASAGAIGMYHHGAQTDKFWAAGKIEQAREMLKVMRDTGVRVGLGTHMPEVVDYVESKGWDFDFYMTCVYNLSRPKAEVSRIAGRPVEGEFFHDPDRELMLQRVRRTSKQCLIFKIYGASRHCDSEERMRAAMQLAVRSAKPSDCIVVGMFPKRSEQVSQNCRLLREALAAV
jgi:hypothetical protein